MRSYGQYCSVAKALDVVGDRWSLLIVRELLLRDACRYTDLLHGLPGIATNLLADRLRTLQGAGLIEREEAPPPVATSLFRLTQRGRDLGPVLEELGRWGAPLMSDAAGDEVFRSHWLALPVHLFLTDRAPDGPPVRIELHTGDEPVVVEAEQGEVRTRPGPVEAPDLVLRGSPQLVVGALSGMVDFDQACERGLEHAGNPGVLRRLQTTPS